MRRSSSSVDSAHDVGGGAPARRVHAHVERRVLRVGEPALGAVELQRRHAEVEEHPLHFAESLGPHGARDAVVDRVHEPGPVAVLREALAGDAERVGVAIEADDGEIREALEEGGRVPAHAERGVDEHGAVGLDGGCQELERALEHHRGVDAFDVHDSALSSWASGPDPHPFVLMRGSAPGPAGWESGPEDQKSPGITSSAVSAKAASCSAR